MSVTDRTPPEMPDDPDIRPSDAFGAWLQALDATANEDDLFGILAGHRPPASRLARQQIRGRLVLLLKDKLGGFESGASPARTADAWLAEGGDPDDIQGQEFVVEETVPWENVVDGATVLDEAAAIYDVYVLMTQEKRDALTLWTVFSHAFECFGVAPILELSSPTKRCGKSSTVIVARYLCRAPLLSGNITPAALFLAIQAWKPTLLVDEADSFARMNDELRGTRTPATRETRRSSFARRATPTSRVCSQPGSRRSWRLSAGCRTRSRIARSGSRCRANRRRSANGTHSTPIKSAATATRSTQDRPFRARQRRCDRDGHGRAAGRAHYGAWNNWRPLLMIATVAGGDWPHRAAQAAIALLQPTETTTIRRTLGRSPSNTSGNSSACLGGYLPRTCFATSSRRKKGQWRSGGRRLSRRES